MNEGTRRASATAALLIGAIMIALGSYIGFRVAMPGASPLTGRRWLDVAFAFFFIARGALQVARWRRKDSRRQPQ